MDWIITHTYILFLWAWSHFLSSPPQKGYQTKQGINNQHKYNMVTLPSILVDSLLLLLEPGFQTPLLLPGCRFCLKMIIIRSTKLWSYVQNNLPESTSFKNSIPASSPPSAPSSGTTASSFASLLKKKEGCFSMFCRVQNPFTRKKHTTFSLVCRD